MIFFFFLQVGDFYEAIGIDACILVEYAGLNPFGGLRSDSIPRAGCPVMVWVDNPYEKRFTHTSKLFSFLIVKPNLTFPNGSSLESPANFG